MHILSLMLASLMLLAAPAAHAGESKHALVEELYVKSGLEKQIAEIPNAIEAQMEQTLAQQSPKQADPATLKQITSLFAEACNVERMRQTIINGFERNLDSKDIQAALAWLDSDIGQKLTRMEESASTPDGIRARALFNQQLASDPPAQQRVELIQRFNQATHSSEQNANLMINVASSVSMAMASAMHKQVTYEQVTAGIEKARPQIEAQSLSMVLVSFLYTYRDASNAELEKYIQFANSESGKKYHQQSMVVLNAAMTDVAKDFGTRLATMLQQKQAATPGQT